MLRVQAEEQIVADLEHLGCEGTPGREAQHRVGAVGMIVHKVVGDLDVADATVRAKGEARHRIGGNSTVPGLQLAPRDRPVIVQVEADGMVQVTQGNVPLPLDRFVLDRQSQIAVARLVRRGGCRHQHNQQQAQEC